MVTWLRTAEHPFIPLAYGSFSKTVQRRKSRHPLECCESYPFCKSCWLMDFYINFRAAYTATDTDASPIPSPLSLKIKLEVSIVVNISNDVLLVCDTFEVICCHNLVHCNIDIVKFVVYCDFTMLYNKPILFWKILFAAGM